MRQTAEYIFRVLTIGQRLGTTGCVYRMQLPWFLGPLHMSSVNRAGSVSVISPRHSFLRKNLDVFKLEPGLARLPKSRISVTGMKIYPPYEHSNSDDQDETS